MDASLQKEGYCFSKDYLFLAKKGLVLIVLPAQERKKVLTRMDVEFGVNRAKVSANRVLRYDQAIGNPVRRTALSEQFEHLELTIGKAVSLDKVLLRQWSGILQGFVMQYARQRRIWRSKGSSQFFSHGRFVRTNRMLTRFIDGGIFRMRIDRVSCSLFPIRIFSERELDTTASMSRFA